MDNDTNEPVSSADHNPLHVMQAGEQLVCEIKRHPIGIIAVYGMVIFVLIVLSVLLFAVVPSVVGDANKNTVNSISVIILLTFALIGAGFAFVNHIIYWGNRWYVTTDSVTQVQQTALFNKQSSQLSLENLEDVTAEKNGLLAQAFNFGVLKCETAGERSKFMFTYCPNPTRYAQYILNARERFMQDVRTKEAARFAAEMQENSQKPKA